MASTKTIVDAAINREIQRQRGQEMAARAVQQLEALILQEQQTVHALALALAQMEGQGVTITALQPSPESGLLVAVHYVTADGQAHSIAVNHADPSAQGPAAGVVLPN